MTFFCGNRKDGDRGIFTEAQVMGMATPSHIKPVDLEKYKTSSPKFDWKVSKTVRIQPLKPTPKGEPEVSPVAYNPEESLKKRIYTSVQTYSYSKEKGKSFIQQYSHSKRHVPSPDSYNMDAAYSRITIGARRGYK